MSSENLIIPEIPEPGGEVACQPPTRDIPTGKGLSLNEELVRSSNTPKDLQLASASLSQEGEVIDGGTKE